MCARMIGESWIAARGQDLRAQHLGPPVENMIVREAVAEEDERRIGACTRVRRAVQRATTRAEKMPLRSGRRRGKSRAHDWCALNRAAKVAQMRAQ